MELRVNDKKELKIIDAENLLSGNVNSYDISLVIDESYKDFIITLIWKNGDIIKKSIITNETESVKIPHEVLVSEGELIIGLFAEKVENDKLIQRNSVNLVYLPVTEGSYTGEGTYTEEIDATILEKYLQEMKNFYNESLEEYNANAQSQLNNFNSNANKKIQQLNDISENVEQIEQNIEKMQENVQKSEANAQTSAENAQKSETNAKQSETNAQTSAENAENSYQATVNIATNLSMLAFYVDENLKLHVVSESDLVNQKFNLVGNKLEVIYFANR